MAGEGGTLGSANIKITADTSEVGPKIDAVKAKVAEIGPAANSAKAEADALFANMVSEGNKAADAAEKATEKVGGLNASMSLLASVGVTLAVSALITLVGWWKRAEEAADKARESFRKAYEESERSRRAAIDGLNELASPATALEKEIAAATRVVDKALLDQTEQLRMAGKASAETYQGIVNRIADLEQQKEETIVAIRKRYADKAAKIEADRLEKEAEERERLIERFIVGQQAQEDADDRATAKAIANAQKRMEMEQRVAEIRLRGILDAQTALDRLYATQAAGFNGDGSNNSLQGSLDALEVTMRVVGARIGGI